MNIGIVGLGRMGSALAERFIQAKHTVYGYDVAATPQNAIIPCASLEALAQKNLDALWLMVPAGDIVDQTLTTLLTHLTTPTIIIDGGNSNYKDSIRRAHQCAQKNIAFLDCGTSGGIHGRVNGFCLMIGGDHAAYTSLIPMWQAAAAPQGFVYTGPSGSGHYVKMVHNGIEYGILQAYAEGLHLLKEGHFNHLDIGAIADVWQHGSVIRSWLLEIMADHLHHDASLEKIPGKIGQNFTGFWTLQAAQERNIETPVLKASLDVRNESQKTGGNYGTKIVSLARLLFGGHVK